MAALGDFQRDFQNLTLKGVKQLDRKELGRGAYGRVYAVQYCGTTCAAKEIHSILIEEVGHLEMQRTVESFLRECHQCSTLRHPNIIQFLGVYYPTVTVGADGVQGRIRLPVMVMEMMADSLTSLVDKHEKIPIHIKFSIVHDVSLGLCYLHNHDPPIIHRDLSPNNVLLTAHHVAKISDLGVAKVIKADSRKTMTKAPGTVDFMPPESLTKRPEYGRPMDVFSFAGIVLHIFTQQWPNPSELVQYDHKTKERIALSEVERRQQYLDKMIGEAKPLRPMVEECLDDDPAARPTITTVCERIQDVYMKESPQDNVITLHQQVEQFGSENEQNKRESAQLIDQLRCKIELLRLENHQKMEQLRVESEQKERESAERIEQLKSNNDMLQLEIQRLKQEHLASTMSTPTQPAAVANKLSAATLASKLKIESPVPLLSALTSGRYDIKWTQLANLPLPMYHAYVTVQDNMVYVTGGISANDVAVHQVYVYDIKTDHWDQLPPSGHKRGIPHIIGDKLAIIGGRLSTTNKVTNAISTFDEASQAWASYYPNLLSARHRPGVVTHLEHVIVAGGAKDGDGARLVQDDIEVLNWIENSHWRKVSINLPVPMGNFSPTITDDHLLIVGYTDGDNRGSKRAYKIPVDDITRSGDQQQTSDTSTRWIAMTIASHFFTSLIPSTSPPVVVGGNDQNSTPTSDIKIYDDFSKSWKKLSSLSSARSRVAIAAVNSNAIIVIGGCTKGRGVDNARSSSLTTVELGQAQLCNHTLT